MAGVEKLNLHPSLVSFIGYIHKIGLGDVKNLGFQILKIYGRYMHISIAHMTLTYRGLLILEKRG